MIIAITGSHAVGKTTLIEGLLSFLNSEEGQMKIGVTGSHGVGKTTLSGFVAGRSRSKFKLLPEAPRQALQFGFPINEDTPIETEVWIFSKQLEMEMMAGDNFVADKCFIDLLAYARFLFKENKALLSILEEITRNAVKNYDKVIYLPAGEFPIEDDGIRSTDPDFQMAIDKLIVEIMKEMGVKYVRIVGDKEERYKEALKYIQP